ncbi:ribosomal-protein-alanine N-acetyltransferase [Streptoalloteichus tenebrarius]|uniref:Ribosomal-protein-alanine N-acetyltransferase n=1 Tax=Streptoalloteichus tenebrarius (strain ATCC 17920 / DSM 40477 / JCM 4838 / CBS 697.72 / NBRC 16177 / NCIMB 11028 / NRRL B-12390 / A12253. 1 / ISP 5477) TaxID=1933 RepID=A0ABT1I2C7_STRSD|nr:GNAT family protein [Streptoalloteichus tenebrarius]MCP2261944.1 ribosomal-protein-alanine N-acetyltransferase [Streptoalloteichus tenebrarius]BFF01245.1 GNAT family protein [Streptoalloteichus tenebrarius]
MRPVDGAATELVVGTRHPGWPARLGPLLVPAGAVALRPPRLFDGAAWSRVRLRDRALLEPWEPSLGAAWEDRNTVLAWPGQWSSLRSMARQGQALPFVITVDGEFSGQITIGNVVRGALRSAWVGYWVAGDRVRGGVATAAVALVADHCFGAAGLHRLEATVRPENAASLRVLAKLGFREEGLFRRYLEVDGAWRDHVCLAMTAEDAPEGLVARLIASGRARRP